VSFFSSISSTELLSERVIDRWRILWFRVWVAGGTSA
jgi:hypothetical protein